MPRRLVTCLLASLAALCLLATGSSAAPFPAAFFPADQVDGPSDSIVRVLDVDVARDGNGLVAYLKLDGGVPHLFVSRLVNGGWQPPERIDGNIAAAATEAVVAASDGGRFAVAWVAAGQIFTVVRAAGTTAWPAPIPGPGGANPSLDMSVNGVAYLVWTAAGDVRAARLERKAPSFTLLDTPLDIVPAAVAGEGTGRPRVAIAADGIATAVWGESGHVYARRLFDTRLSTAPQQLDVAAFSGLTGGAADQPDVDAEDDSSFAWVVFRQAFSDGTTKVLGRRLRGSLFDDPVNVGPPGETGSEPRIDLNGRGDGFVTTIGTATRTPYASSLQQDAFAAPTALSGPLGIDPMPQPAMTEGGDGVVAWMSGTSAADAIVKARSYDNGKPVSEAAISNPAFGLVDPAGGFASASNRAGDVVTVFVQGSGAERRIASGAYDRAPGSFVVNTRANWRNGELKISWSASFELWGPLTYTVIADGAQIAQTAQTSFSPNPPLPDGIHRVQVIATDKRGQKSTTKTAMVRVDRVVPELSVSVSGKRVAGERLTFRRVASDVGSGLESVTFAVDDGEPSTTPVLNRTFDAGWHTVTVAATDRAGNVTTVAKRVQIKKAKKAKKE